MKALNLSKERGAAGRAADSDVVKQRGQDRLQKFVGSTWAITGYPRGFCGRKNWLRPATKKFQIFLGGRPLTSNGIRSNSNFNRRRKRMLGSSGRISLNLNIFISLAT